MLTPEELASQFLRIDEIGTPECPKQRLVLQMPTTGGLVIDAGILAEECSLKSRRDFYVNILAALATRAVTEVALPPEDKKAKTIYDRLLEEES